MSDVLDTMHAQAPVDPDAQATVTDFLDYTEYLPSDLIRSLTLIRKLDDFYVDQSSQIHELTKTYGSLPAWVSNDRPDPQDLRSQISRTVTKAITARESSFAESSRLYDVVDRHFNRLTSIISKLQSLPQPPSRDPTPAPQPAGSPQSHRARIGRKPDGEELPTPRITLRLDGAPPSTVPRPAGSSSRHKNRNRRITVPGEVLPPPNPDSPPPSLESDWESTPPSPVPIATSRVGAPARRDKNKSHRVKVPKVPKPPKIRAPKTLKPPRQRRPAGVMGTNVHSAVAGISTSNALALLKPPPENVVPGSEDAPWLRLTAWEMAKLRKRMKKNAVWNPSETMIRRELADLGRGPDNYHAAKAKSEATGQPFVDAANIAETASLPGKRILAEGEISVDSLGMEEIQLSNRGMKLNEAKKLKKENMQRELAAQLAAEKELTTRNLAGSSSGLKTLLPHSEPAAAQSVPLAHAKEKDASKASHKRKREVTPPVQPTQPVVVPAPIEKSKKRKTEVTPATSVVGNTAIKVPLAAPGPSKTPTPMATAVPPVEKEPLPILPNRRRGSLAPAATPPENVALRPRSRGNTAPVEDPITAGKDRPRRASTVVTPVAEPVQPTRSAGRRGKRPVPGRLTAESSEGGAAVIVGKRAAAPRKKVGGKKTKGEDKGLGAKDDEADDEDPPVDPDEPRYCSCGDVSWGTMIMCENADCEREWFHLECVGLSEIPGRTTKWYCPECRKKFGPGDKGQASLRNKKK
ncbi:MAG: hypothetical protein M4579_006749 [Chaenotheca gracillima]|nr:MAG: hypothetical protein M4579_006749 [Chaenotheca gracillima]